MGMMILGAGGLVALILLLLLVWAFTGPGRDE